MAQERTSIYDLVAFRGIERRDFLKFCGSTAAMLGLSEMHAPQIAAAIEKAAKLKPVVWLDLALCTGCTESVAQSDYPDAATVVLDLLSVNYWETITAAAGTQAEEAKAKTIEDGGYVVVVEGAILKGDNGNYLRIADKTSLEVLMEAASKADAIIAIGSCAVDGGWVKGEPNTTEAVGVKDVAEELGFGDKALVNLPGCPVNPRWLVATVVDYLLLGKVPDLDDLGRPKLIYGSTIHDNCERRGHFENGEFVEAFGTPEEAMNYCLYKVGCKGPQTLANCGNVRWNRRQSWCVGSGGPCIGCTNMDWVDRDAPFAARMENVATIKPETIGFGLGAVALGGLVVHGIAQTATGRLGHGAPVEEKKGGDK